MLSSSTMSRLLRRIFYVILGGDGKSNVMCHLLWIMLLSCAVYANTLHNSFHLDDFYRITENPHIEKIWPISRHFLDASTMSTIPRITEFRPLLPLTLSINYAISGHALTGYHLFSIAIHTLSAFIIYLFCVELLAQVTLWKDKPQRNRWLALLVSMVFVVHPVSGYLVNYLCARDYLMMELFLMCSLLLYISMRRLGDSWWRWSLILFLYTLSLLSKPKWHSDACLDFILRMDYTEKTYI